MKSVNALVVCGLFCLLSVSPADQTQDISPGFSKAIRALRSGSVKRDADFGKMPIYFIANSRQMDERVAYYVQGKDKSLYFTPDGMTIVLSGHDAGKDKPDASVAPEPEGRGRERQEAELTPESRWVWVVKVDFVGANKDAKPEGVEKTEAVISYFKGGPEEWRAGLPTYSKIIYRDLWPGVDLAYSGTVDKLKYEFVVHPGADPGQVQLGYRGVSGIRVDEAGRLEVETPRGSFNDEVPEAYQEAGGERRDVGISYETSESEPGGSICGFRIAEYDRTQTLIIDPAVLIYCGFIGGFDNDHGFGIAVDGSGNAYVTGYTESPAGFPVTVGPDLSHNGNFDAFVAKVNPSGTALIYCGYIGGSRYDWGQSIAVDGSGNAYVTGNTLSTEATFPVAVGPDLSSNGNGDAFVAKVNASGTALAYCGYIGGSLNDGGCGIAVDSSGNAYVTGYAESTEATFPAAVGPDLTYNGGNLDAFVAKVNASGTGLAYSGYIGGSGTDRGLGIAVDGSGNAYVTGETSSTEATFPAAAGPDLTYNGGLSDAFVAKVNASGAGLAYSGYVGGSNDDSGYGIAVDGSGNAYVTGKTSSTEAAFPLAAGPDLTYNGGIFDAFVAKVNASGTGLAYCGYIGGSERDEGYGIALDGFNNAYVTGYTESTETTFPATGGPDLSYNGNGDAFVAKVDASGIALAFCGYIGSSNDDGCLGIAVDSSGNAYVTGDTSSTEATFPVTVGPDLTYNGGLSDAFVAKIGCSMMKNDFNGDGQADILWRYNGAGGFNSVWFMGAGSGASSIPASTLNGPAGSGARSTVFADARQAGDGRGPNLAFLDPREALSPSFGGEGIRGFLSPRNVKPPRPENGTPASPQALLPDPRTAFSSDIAGNPQATPVRILGGADLPSVADLAWKIVGTGDFNNDGKTDLLWRYNGTGGYLCVWYLNGTAVLGGADLPAVADLNWQVSGTGDFNGDGKVDILWRYQGAGGYQCVWYMNGTAVTGGADLPGVSDLTWQVAGLGDFNADGKTDLLWRYLGTGGYVCVWFMNGTAVTGGVDLPSVGDLAWQVQEVADFTGDGKPDLIWRYYGSGGYNCVWFLKGTTLTGGQDIASVPDLNWKVVSR